jgi:hypothetical protein
LEPVHAGGIIMGMGSQASQGEMRANVSDGRRFVSFLHGLNPDQVERTDLKTNLENLSEILARQALGNYDLNHPSDEALQLLGNLGQIVGEYQRLGMSQSIQQLDTYLAHSRQGDLREYVLIEYKGYLSAPGESFGPADWQRDTSDESLKAKWDEAIDTLRKTRTNPNAKPLYDQLQNHLLKCIKIAREDLEKLKQRPGYTPEYYGEKATILEEAHMQLDDLRIKD